MSDASKKLPIHLKVDLTEVDYFGGCPVCGKTDGYLTIPDECLSGIKARARTVGTGIIYHKCSCDAQRCATLACNNGVVISANRYEVEAESELSDDDFYLDILDDEIPF